MSNELKIKKVKTKGVCVCVCVRACVRARVRACVRACVCVCAGPAVGRCSSVIDRRQQQRLLLFMSVFASHISHN